MHNISHVTPLTRHVMGGYEQTNSESLKRIFNTSPSKGEEV